MKYVLSWKPRLAGSGAENENDYKHVLDVFSSWEEPSDVTFHEFLQRLDGAGGFAVVESDNPASVLEGPTKFGPWFEFTVTPVMDFRDGVPVFGAGVEFRSSVRAG
jgi:hypothetical protein